MMRLLLFLIKISPLSVLYLFAWGIGLLLYVLGVNQRRICEVNLKLCFPSWSDARRQRLCRRNMVETVKNLLESLKLWTASRSQIQALTRKISGEEVLRQAHAKGKGVLLLLPHIGNWEMVNMYCSEHFSVSGLYRPQKSKALDDLMRRGREKFGSHAYPADTSGVRALLRALKQDHLVIILPDQNPGQGTGVFAPFFGVLSNSPVLPARLVGKTGAEAILAYAERLPYGRGFHLHFVPCSANLAQADAQAATAELNLNLEQVIRQIPEQYWWGYSRFRHRPDGEAPLYEKD